jgi:hypothetical protein
MPADPKRDKNKTQYPERLGIVQYFNATQFPVQQQHKTQQAKVDTISQRTCSKQLPVSADGCKSVHTNQFIYG